MIRFQEEQFLMNGGDEQWLQGVQYAPKRFAKFNELNAILAHKVKKMPI